MGLGETLVPYLAEDVWKNKLKANLDFIEIVNPKPVREVGMIYRKSHPRKKFFHYFEELMVKQFKKIEKKTEVFRISFSSKLNPNGRGTTRDFLEDAWGARVSKFSRNTFSTAILYCIHMAVFSTVLSAFSSYVL